MSTYSTWLLFMKEATSVQSFFQDIYLAVDSTFLISKPTFGSLKEEIMCIYRIEISDLQIEKFASWTKEAGIAEPTNVLHEKTKDFKGKIMRIGIYKADLAADDPHLQQVNQQTFGLDFPNVLYSYIHHTFSIILIQ